METEHFFELCRAFAVPGAVLVVGALGAVRLALSRGAIRQRLFSAVVLLCLAVSAAVSLLKIPTEMDGLRPGNPYPIGIGGLPEQEQQPGMISPLSM